MARISVLFLPLLAMIAGCAGPIETRIKTHAISALPAVKTYNFAASAADEDGALYVEAQSLVAATLSRKGFRADETGQLAVDIAIANRPASIALSTGQGDEQTVIALKKERRPLQSCDDFEHRVTITMVDQIAGTAYYKGSAAEYHCKAAITDSLPYLVAGALSDLGNAVDTSPRMTTRQRSGIE